MVNQTDVNLYPARKPTYVTGRGILVNATASEFLTKYPRTFASITLTVGGSVTDGDTMTVNLNLAPLSGGKIAKTIAIVSGDTTTTVAQKIVKAFADDATFQAYGGVIHATAAVVTVKWPSLIGNEATLTRTLSGGATITGTIANSGVFASGAGPVIPFKSFTFAHQGTTYSLEAGKPANLPAVVVKAMVAAKQPIY